VQVHWAIVASQFPALAFAISDVEFRGQYPNLKLTLPLDDVLRQLPPGVIPTGWTPSQIAGLEAFPAPFQPLPVPRDVPAASARPGGAAADLPPAVAAPPPPAPVAAPPRDPVAESLRSAPAAPTITPPPAPAIVTSAPPLPIPPTRV